MYSPHGDKKVLFTRAKADDATSEWCADAIPLEVLGVAGQVALPIVDPHGGRTGACVVLGVILELAPGKYSRTKIIRFTPRYIIKNGLQHDVMLRESDITPQVGGVLLSLKSFGLLIGALS
jgi:hypothetical protein